MADIPDYANEIRTIPPMALYGVLEVEAHGVSMMLSVSISLIVAMTSLIFMRLAWRDLSLSNRSGVQANCSQEQGKAKVFHNIRLDCVPYRLVIGQREAEEGTVSVRHRDKDDLGTKPLEGFIAEITAEIKSRSL
jgi:hypothetical protein